MKGQLLPKGTIFEVVIRTDNKKESDLDNFGVPIKKGSEDDINANSPQARVVS